LFGGICESNCGFENTVFENTLTFTESFALYCNVCAGLKYRPVLEMPHALAKERSTSKRTHEKAGHHSE